MVLKKQREAFSMLTAIFVIIIMATVGMLVMNLSGKMIKQTTAQFQREQAMLLANAYTEFAIMAVTANDHNTSTCLNNISGTYGDYTVVANISYIARPSTIDGNCRTLSTAVTETSSPLNIIIDVFVKYPDYDHPNDLNMTYHKRKLEKI